MSEQEQQSQAEEQAQTQEEQAQAEAQARDLDARYQQAKDDLYNSLQEEGVTLVDVAYYGEEDVYNYDVAPYNLIKDEETDYVGQSAVLRYGDVYTVPEDLAERMYQTAGFEPYDGSGVEATEQGQDQPEAQAEPSQQDASQVPPEEQPVAQAAPEENDAPQQNQQEGE